VASRDSQLTANVCLALVAEGPTHGWALVRALAPDADIGRIWSVTRPLVYRALDGLVAGGLVSRAAPTPGQGPERAILRATPRGRRAVTTWLDEPVAHLRDVRTALLVKLALRARRGLTSQALLLAQREAFAPAIRTLTRRSAADDPVLVWRRETARAVDRFLQEAVRREHAMSATAASSPVERRGLL
jgi:PadR family transcriptional regulator AphA